MIEHFKKVTGVERSSPNKNGVFGVQISQESKLQLYKFLANSRTEQKTIKHTHRLPEFIYLQQSNSLTSYMFASAEFEYGGVLYTPGSNVIKEALESISHKIDDPRYNRGVCYSGIETSLMENDVIEKRNMYWLTRKGSNFIIYLDMEVICGEDYKTNPEKYGDSDIILPLYQAAQKYEMAPNLKIAEELKRAYDLMGFSMMAAEVEKKAQRPKRYCIIV